MRIGVYSDKTGILIICSTVKAARIIGVTPKTLYEWAKSKVFENYNCFTIYLNCTIEKQPKRNKKGYIKPLLM